jgi:uncharacterized membrane protein
MPPALLEWLNLLIRWVHVVAGIMWIGSSLFFVWMENNLRKNQDGVEELRMVHGGGYWQVQKRLFETGKVPDDLKWFKWEAYTTWLSGSCLLVVAYYLDRSLLTDPTVAKLTHGMAVAIGLGSLVLGWALYDGLWRSPLARNIPVCAGVSFMLLMAAVYGLTHLLSGRAAFLHVGAMLGTLMAGNVFMHIIPNQRRVLEAIGTGAPHDTVRMERARMRSRSNNYMTLPVVFIMISNHYSSAYSGRWNWLILGILILAGVAVNHILNLKESSHVWEKYWMPASAGIAFAAFGAIFLLIGQVGPSAAGKAHDGGGGETVRFSAAQAVIAQRCASCHAAKPTDPAFPAPPLGVRLDTPESILLLAPRIEARAVVQKSMPLGNKTQMTDAERELLGRWIAQGARGD